MILGKKQKWLLVAAVLIVILMLFNKIRYISNNIDCEFTVYTKENLPEEFQSYIIPNQSFAFIQPAPKTLLLCEQSDLGAYTFHGVNVHLNQNTVYVDLEKRWANNDWEMNGSVFYVVITLPESRNINNIEIQYRSILSAKKLAHTVG